MQCPQCHYENRAGRRFCAECGAPLDVSCPACAFVNEPGEKFCGGCGTALTGHLSAPGQVPSSPRDEEGRFLALLRGVIWTLQRDRRVTYRELKHVFDLDEIVLDEIREELRPNLLRHARRPSQALLPPQTPPQG
jgi:hypothetical protein